MTRHVSDISENNGGKIVTLKECKGCQCSLPFNQLVDKDFFACNDIVLKLSQFGEW